MLRPHVKVSVKEFSIWYLLFTILVEPTEEFSVPMYRVLWSEDPVVLFWEQKHF